MAKEKLSKKEELKEKVDKTFGKFEAFMKSNKKFHYNFEDTVNYCISTGSMTLDTDLVGFEPGMHRFIGVNEGGKEQPVSEPVLTPDGWSTMGDVAVGDKVIGSDGKPQIVLGVFPQGEKDVYEVQFSDGKTVRCGIDHLWETSSFSESKEGLSSAKDLNYIIKTLNRGKVPNHHVRLVDPVELEKKEFRVSPYLMGAVLSDEGISSSMSVTSDKEDVWDEIIKVLIQDYPTAILRDSERRILFLNNLENPMIRDLNSLSVLGKMGEEKEIPEAYLMGSKEQRLSLVQGLADSNGYVDKKSSKVVYYSSSKRLASQLAELVRSLGGVATVEFKKSSYVNEEKKRRSYKNHHLVTFYLPSGLDPFRSKTKMKNYSLEGLVFDSAISDIVKVGVEESVCIKVSNRDSLYVTKDYVLTHNTSQALQVIYQGLKDVPNTKALFIKAEGRLSETMKKRSGIKFTENKEIKNWKKGECFVFETNIFEVALDFVSMIIAPENNPENIKYLIILDSVDGLIPLGDLDKNLSDAAKIAGGAVISSAWCKRQSIALGKRGHMMIMISQVRAKVDIDGGRGAPSVEPTRQISSTGGNALMHYANYIWEFLPRWSGDLILQDPKLKQDQKTNKIIGHYARMKVKKSPTEKSNNVYTYPIIYGRTGGRSIWKEKEIVDLMLPWGMIEAAGSWFTFSDQFFAVAGDSITIDSEGMTKEEIEDLPIEGRPFPSKVQGMNNVFSEIEARPKLVDTLSDYFIEMIGDSH